MIKSTPFFWVVCDGCQRSAQEDQDHAAWQEEWMAVESAMDGEWWSPAPGNAHYCPACTRIRQPAEQPSDDTGAST